MSAWGTLRSRLEAIHDMLPLSDREKILAEWVLYMDGEVGWDEILTDPWWGKKAAKVVRYLVPDEELEDA